MGATGKVVILGGGPAGLAIADELAERGHAFTLIERAPILGGLAQSVDWKDYGSHDLGPHKIFTTDAELFARIKNLLPASEWLLREKKSSIYMKGHYLPYPPSPFSLINVYGPVQFFRMCLDYGFSLLGSFFSKASPVTFEEDLQKRVGNQLYSALFKPIAQKLWGDPRHLDSKLSKGRVQTPKLSEIIGRLAGVKKTSEFEALDFSYPKGGLQGLWDAIHAKGKDSSQFLVNHEVLGIERSDSRITKILYKNRSNGEEKSLEIGADDFVFSSLPMRMLAQFLKPSVSAPVQKALDEKVILNDLLLVFFYVDKRNFLDESWVFIPDPEIVFHRLSEQESFDPGMTPNGSIVCCEIMDNELRPMGKKSDEELCALALDGLKKMGFTGFTATDQRVIRLPASYPVFRPGYEEALQGILAEFDTLQNLRTIGRQGAFNYIGTLDAMDIGYGAARWYLKSVTDRQNSRLKESWESERERTQHYPVLD